MSIRVYTGNQMEKINNENTPNNNQIIFRYMDFSKYVDLLESSKLYFCNSQYFEDKLEGTMPERFYHGWPQCATIGHKHISKQFDTLFPEFVNCWNKDEYESYALWKIYTNNHTGVCIKTTVGNLKKALNNNDIKIFKVKYIKSFEEIECDLEPPWYDREIYVNGNQLRIRGRVKGVYKLDPYHYENEVRAIYIDKSKKNGLNIHVELNSLISEVYLSPFSAEWFKELVIKITLDKKYCLKDIVFQKSRIIL